MKRVLIGLMVLILTLSVAGAALAAAPKVPKNLCLDILGTKVSSLVVKMQGTLKTATGPVKMYNINGAWRPGLSSEVAVSGTGFVGTDGLFHFSYGGTLRGAATIFYVLGVTGTLDLTLGTGTLDFAFMENSAIGGNVITSNQAELPITVADCTTVLAPISEEEKLELDALLGPKPVK